MFYVGRELKTARLILKGTQAYAILPELEPNSSKKIIVDTRVELDFDVLTKMNPALGADYFYKREIKSADTATSTNANLEVP